MKKVLSEKCPNCGASLNYDIKNDKFKCDYCNSEFTLEELKKTNEDNNQAEYSVLDDINGYHCDNCGAEIISLDNITSTTCIYCKSNAIIKNRLSGVYKPDSIITFKFKKEDAIKAFRDICKGRPLLPKKFNNVENISEMEGLYVPFWLYDIDNDAYLKADCTKVSTWMDRNYIYTKTSYYNVERKADLKFKSIPNDAASRFEDIIMNAIEPFNYKDLKDFNTSYLAGFLSERYDVNKEEAIKNVTKRIENDSQTYLKSTINGYNTTVVKDCKNNLSQLETKYVLLPVWVLNIKYKDKIYHFAMNGQTGKMVGEIPVDTKKLIILIVIVFFSIFLIGTLIFMLLGYRW